MRDYRYAERSLRTEPILKNHVLLFHNPLMYYGNSALSQGISYLIGFGLGMDSIVEPTVDSCLQLIMRGNPLTPEDFINHLGRNSIYQALIDDQYQLTDEDMLDVHEIPMHFYEKTCFDLATVIYPKMMTLDIPWHAMEYQRCMMRGEFNPHYKNYISVELNFKC